MNDIDSLAGKTSATIAISHMPVHIN